MNVEEIDEVTLENFLKEVHKKYGYNFNEYSKNFIKRRLSEYFDKFHFKNFLELRDSIINSKEIFYNFLSHLLIPVTEMFRDPQFFFEIKEKVFPILKTYPYIKMWHAGCASGEEVYSMAILLEEAGLLNKTLLYATDIHLDSLQCAQNGIYRLQDLEKAACRYHDAGGKEYLSNYYVHKYGYGKILDRLKENIVFSDHNLESDGIFGDMHVILCRNVFIYFTKDLQNKILNKFYESLITRGFYCFGCKESIDFLDAKNLFESISQKGNIFRKTL